MPQETTKIVPSEEAMEKYKNEEGLRFERSKRLLKKILRLENEIKDKQLKVAALMNEIEFVETNPLNQKRLMHKVKGKIARIEHRSDLAEYHDIWIFLGTGLIVGVIYVLGVLGLSFVTANYMTEINDAFVFPLSMFIGIVLGLIESIIPITIIDHWSDGTSANNEKYRKLKNQLQQLERDCKDLVAKTNGSSPSDTN